MNCLNGMFRVLLAEGGVTFSTSHFDAVKSVTVSDEGYEFEFPEGYFDKGELLSGGDKAAIVIMSLLGFGLAVTALYYLILIFRAHQEQLRSSLSGEEFQLEGDKAQSGEGLEVHKIYKQKSGGMFSSPLNDN
jgi:hypothetical protein